MDEAVEVSDSSVVECDGVPVVHLEVEWDVDDLISAPAAGTNLRLSPCISIQKEKLQVGDILFGKVPGTSGVCSFSSGALISLDCLASGIQCIIRPCLNVHSHKVGHVTIFDCQAPVFCLFSASGWVWW